jgi:hypothetical protein
MVHWKVVGQNMNFAKIGLETSLDYVSINIMFINTINIVLMPT